MAPDPPEVTIRFYEELNFFLKPEQRKRDCSVPFRPGDTVKFLIESLGVPHTEVDLVLVDGRSVAFSHRLRPGERVSVFPVFESLDIRDLTRVRSEPLRDPRFVVDVHLGRLAKTLRMLGFDSLYSNRMDDRSLAEIAGHEKRILLTRDRELLKRSLVSHGYYVRSPNPLEQLAEVVRRFDLARQVRPFTLCLRCNEPLVAVSKTEVLDKVPEHVARSYHRFRRCPLCGRIYWPGTHWESMRKALGLSP
ncbi:MAG: Mut7-C ubiquitin/RNAse domain-containing protein [Spirochaetales bacterium]|nr:Mut7-C ubiquitin/RNAse domain-containing protein [Spirochaetales bacterium]